ncbi:MAG: ATP-binding protein [Pseudomonadota bacterium]
MKACFVKTGNAARFLAALAALNDRGAAEACLMVVDGEPGLGKTTIINWWAVQEGCVYLRCKKEWTPSWMLRELLGALRVTPGHSFERMYGQALQELGSRARAAARDGSNFAVVVDEVDHISRRADMLETLRDLSDMLEIPFVLVGMGRVRHNLTRFPQVASRIGQLVEFRPCGIEDVQALVKGLCEVPVADDLVEFLQKVSEGFTREVKEGIKSIERFGKRNPGKTIDCQMMDGQVLLNDRRTGKPIVVRVER